MTTASTLHDEGQGLSLEKLRSSSGSGTCGRGHAPNDGYDQWSLCVGFMRSPRLHASSVTQRVNTTQVAPTILQALGLDPRVLQSARAEGTRPLPGLWF